jgi:hypothetical protein
MSNGQLCFFNPYAEIRHTENRLPHWQQTGAVYFVTFRLADAIPRNLLAQWEADREGWLRFHPEPWSIEVEQEYHRRFSGTIERCVRYIRRNPRKARLRAGEYGLYESDFARSIE